MYFIKSRPYLLFLITAVILIAVGFFVPKEYIDINIHDTYFVILKRDLAILLSLPYILLGLIYFGLLKFNFKLINWITIFHVAASILGLCIILILNNLIKESTPGDFQELINCIEFNEKIAYGIGVVIFTIIAAQILFLINIVFGLTKGKKPIKTQLKL